MSTEDKMSIDERRKYLRQMKKRYEKAGRKEKGQLLDEMEVVTELDRKTLIRLMNGSLKRKARRKQRGRTYGTEVEDALRVIAPTFEYICAERLAPNLVWMAQHLTRHGELEVTDVLLAKLGQVSVSTVGRLLRRIRQDEPRLPRKGPRRANRLTRDIPMLRLPWSIQVPGFFEVDLVHHCGPTTAGEYMCTLQMTDVATGWSKRMAVLGRRRLFGIAKHMLGWTKLELGLYRQAQDLFQMSFALFEEMDEREMMGRSFLGESALALVKENHEAARTWAEKSAAMIQEIGQQSVGSSALRCMAIAALRLGKRCQARALLREALGIALEIRTLTSTIQPIAGTALLLAGAGDAERAVELYALASRYPYIGNSRWWDDVAGKNIAAAAATLPPDIVATCQDRGRTRDPWETAEALLDELCAQ